MLLQSLTPVLATDLVIDDFAYTNSAAARARWLANGNAPLVSMAESGPWGSETVMILPCDFATRATRCFWDRTVALNLAGFTDFALEVYADDPSAVSGFTLYFRSGGGWYGGSAALLLTGWQTLHFSASEFISEGTPAGWNQIQGIRLSPWKGVSRNTDLAVRELRSFTPTVLLIRDTRSSNPGIVTETIDRHLDYLERYSISCGVITQAGVEAGLLDGCRVAILPYNENLSDLEWTRLEAFVAAGGRLVVYYLLPARLEPLLGIRRTGWTPGEFAAWAFSDPGIQGLPARVEQASWNITLAEPNGTLNARVVADWEDRQGRPTGNAAWILSDHGLFLSHVLLGDDADQKAYTLLCLLGHQLPELWIPAAESAVEQIGVFAGYPSYAEAVAAIGSQARTTLRAGVVESELSAAAADRAQALARLSAGDPPAAAVTARSAQQHLKQAFIRSHKPSDPEFRAFWEHHATGPYPGDWPAAIDVLASNGFNAVFPNMLWGGLAHYASDWLPRSSEFAAHGDQIAACVAAAHARGLEVHVWKVNWNLSGAPRSFVDELRAANRTQVTRDGLPMDWLCPSHPENVALETNSLLEVVRNYDVEGIHLDYIRYPGSECCYCAGCATRFQEQTGRTVGSWPADVLTAGTLRTAFLDWRRAQITRFVAALHAGVKALKPGVRLSAAVFPDAVSAYDEVGQDWRAWIEAGTVDFLCPMDYTADLHRFTNLVAQQLTSAGGRLPVYPGLGAHALEPDGVVAQIQAARAAGTGGFIVFELASNSATTLLPALRAGVTAPDEPDRDGDLIADSWEARWFGDLEIAGPGTDPDGDRATDLTEYTAGTDPTLADSGVTIAIRRVGEGAEITCPARPTGPPGYRNAQRTYRLERTRQLQGTADWGLVPGLSDRTVGAAPETFAFAVTPVAGESWVYRVRVWLEQPESWPLPGGERSPP